MSRTPLERFAAQRDFYLDLPDTPATAPAASSEFDADRGATDLSDTVHTATPLPARTRGRALLVAATTVAVALTGVTIVQQQAPPPTAPSAGTTATPVPGEVAAVPVEEPLFEAFTIVLAPELTLIDRATRTLEASCLVEAGYPLEASTVPGPATKTLEPLVASMSSLGGPTTPERARSHGFGEDAAAQAPKMIYDDPAFSGAQARCTAQALAELQIPTSLIVSYYDVFHEMSDAYYDAVLPVFRSYFDGVVGCLDDSFPVVDPDARNYPDLFGVPTGNTGTEQPPDPEPGTTPGVRESSPAVPASPYVPTTPEVELAVAYVGCGDQDNLRQNSLQQMSSTAEEVVAGFADRFAPLNTELSAAAERATQYLPN